MSFISHTVGAGKLAPKVFIASPSYTGKFDSRFLHAMIESLPLLEKNGIGYEVFTLANHCHVDDSRNKIVWKFLQSDCESLIFLDADVAWEPESLLALAQYDRDIVAGVYPKRSMHDMEYPVHVAPGTKLYSDKEGLVEVLGAPTGFMKIKRHVLEKMAKKNGHRRYKSKAARPDEPAETIIFERTYEGGVRYGGDIAFCRNWAKMGGKVYIDPEMNLTHLGEIEFTGRLGDFWKEKHGVGDALRKEGFKAAVESLRSGKCTDKDIAALIKGWGNNLYGAPAELLASCYWLAKGKVGHVLETGSGLSTIVMALSNPLLRIHCLEHEIIWASKLKYELKVHGINNVTVHHNELKTYPEGEWYDTEGLPDVEYTLALCDGPPRRISNRSIFYDKMDDKIKKAVVLMDDADDDLAVEPLKTWGEKYGRKVEVLGSQRRFAISS